MPTILCYGDSNTHGTPPLTELGHFARYEKAQRWPELLSLALCHGVDLVAEGLPGRTTVHDDPVEGGRRSGLDVLPAILLSHVPIDLMVLMLGTNDLKARFSVTSHEIARSVERLVLEARLTLPELDILVVSPAPVRERGVLGDVFQGAEEKQKDLDRHVHAAAVRQGCAFLAAGEYVTVSELDGVHWDTDAHATFADALAAAIRAHFPAFADAL